LRLTDKTPDDVIQLAAKCLKAGGAHPILLNDDKIINGLKHCGDGIGGKGDGWEGWDSEIALEDARNYACDGCYEPQIVGKNWFTLGGFPMP
jgi:pyruvate-formate lyase